ncbi:Lipoxygenase y domain-containing protein 1 [Liparis tanakae]|uniref:Lipoxygenase y domain-containing protein 1 n=1 Tax=Liparis tanakae TaxID=230148 RepID=A0A4Z2E1S8_9TELE|nr:Lipoxygenase y domain-containing protein 1 [Liparis tanakae]
MGNKMVYEIPISRWFAMDEDDGKIQRDMLVGGNQPIGIVYSVQIVTGNIRGAGTNSKIHVVMHGSKGMKNSGKVRREIRRQLELNAVMFFGYFSKHPSFQCKTSCS